jgi:methylated-DNA-[protein]-cysteine S-methyltransferase
MVKGFVMLNAEGLDYCTLGSEFGEIIVVWGHSVSKILRIFLPRQRFLFEESLLGSAIYVKDPDGVITVLCQGISDLLLGKNPDFDLGLLDWSVTSFFQKSVLYAESKIPRGMVSAYGQIAKRLGTPRAARAVGTALARNPFPLIIPCHRAIRVDRSLGGYAGGLPMKRRLLEIEGVEFDRYGRILADKLW